MQDWKSDYSVGNEAIDLQHRKLLAMCNQCEEFVGTTDSERFHILLNDLSDYVRVHFDYEESLLRKFGYSKLSEHIAEHEKYWEQLTEILVKSSAGMDGQEDVRQLLKEWWLHHIQEVDMQYRCCVTG